MIFQNHVKKETLSILQINIGRAATSHEIAVLQAYSIDIDIILIQEP
jgi:hypothetical protein